MTQQSLLDELSGIIRLGLEERQVPLTRPGWVIEWNPGTGWQLSIRLQPGLPLLVADNQLVVFREEEELRPILSLLPVPSAANERFGAGVREQIRREGLAQGRRRRRLGETDTARIMLGIKDIGDLRRVRESVMAASLNLDPDFFEPVRPEEKAAFRALLGNSVTALTGVVETLDDLIDRMQDLV
jgi:hypothetical protein